MKSTSITQSTVLNLVQDNAGLKLISEEILSYFNKIASKATELLLNPQYARDAWKFFLEGSNKFPHTIPIGAYRLSDFPTAQEAIKSADFTEFQHWVKKNVTNKEVLEQAVLRGAFHFFHYCIDRNETPPESVLEVMRKEFEEINSPGQTIWLSEFVNAIPNTMIEVFMVSEIAGKVLN